MEKKMNKKESMDSLEWNRTFNQQGINFTVVMIVVVMAWMGALITFAGIIFWLLSKLVGL